MTAPGVRGGEWLSTNPLPPRPFWAARIRKRRRCPLNRRQVREGSCSLRARFRVGLRQPDLDSELVLAGGNRFAGQRPQARSVKPALHLAVGEAETAMGEIVAQEFQIVR